MTSGVPAIEAKALSRTFRVPVREAGLGASMRSVFKREWRIVKAVDNVDLRIEPGEVVGFLGPNGAGKTTTIKMLSGLLHPTAGDATVLGQRPWERSRELLTRIALVMGQRRTLSWDLPAGDSFLLLREIYRVDHKVHAETLAELTELLDLSEIITKPVRTLSLGERMRCELAGALLHKPELLFLDEPTLGLDVAVQRRIREFIAHHNREHQSTVLLTSHYMADIEALCERVIVIHHGRVLHDGSLAELSDRFGANKTVTIETRDRDVDLADFGDVVSANGHEVVLRVARTHVGDAVGRLLANVEVLDLSISDPPIEEVIERVFASGDAALADADAAANATVAAQETP